MGRNAVLCFIDLINAPHIYENMCPYDRWPSFYHTYACEVQGKEA